MPTIDPGTALNRAAYERLDALVKLYTDAVSQLQVLERELRRGTYRRRYLRARINEAHGIIRNLLDYRDGRAVGSVAVWARESLPATYQYGAGLAVRDLGAQGLTAVAGSPRIHTRAVAALVDRFLTDQTLIIAKLHANTLRASQIVLEQAGFGTDIAAGQIGGIPRRTISRELARTLRRRVSAAAGADVDITHIDVGKRLMSVENWAEMHARTELARSSTAGTRVLSVQNGVRHVQITSHAHAPCICTPFEGRIYALDEGDTQFPWIGDVPGGGCPMHPNCVHREAPAVIRFLEARGEVEGRTSIPADFRGLDEAELARLVRENRDQLDSYSRRRAGWLPADFTLRKQQRAA